MRTTLSIAATLLLTVCAGPALARVMGEPPSLEFGTMNGGLTPYNRVLVDCGRLDHAYGRNAAWGRWRMPLAQIRFEAPVAGKDKVTVAISCRDGASCIQAGKFDATPDRIATHSLTFETDAAARTFIDQLGKFQAACAQVG